MPKRIGLSKFSVGIVNMPQKLPPLPSFKPLCSISEKPQPPSTDNLQQQARHQHVQMLQSLLQQSRTETARGLIRSMPSSKSPFSSPSHLYTLFSLSSPPLLNPIFFNIILSVCSESKMVSESKELYMLMKEEGVFPSAASLNLFLESLVSAKLYVETLQLSSEIFAAELPPDQFMYGKAIQAAVKLGDLRRATELMTGMWREGVRPSVFVYNVVIGGLCKEKRITDAKKLFEEMLDRKLAPNRITYDTLIDGYCNKKNLCTWNFSELRNYQNQKFSQPRNRRLNCNSHFYHHFSRKVPVRFGHFPEVLSRENYSALEPSNFQHWFKNWEEQRRHKLTASTFAGAVGFWPHRRVQIWLEKLGAIKPFSGNLATFWTNTKEKEALERYELITGNTVLFPEFQDYGEKNPEDNWLGASPDGAVERLAYGLDSQGVLEIKCPFFDGDKRRALPWSQIPLYCIPQAQGLMEIMDRDWMDFYVWTLNGSSLFRLYRDEEYWHALKMALSDFWFQHVQPARNLCSEYVINDPLIELRSLKPKPRHELYSYIVYESKRIVDSSKLLMREIHGKLQY